MPRYQEFTFSSYSSTGDEEGEQQNLPPFPQFPFPSMSGQGEQQNMPPFPQFPFPPFPSTGNKEGEQQNMPPFPFPPHMGNFPFPPPPGFPHNHRIPEEDEKM